jgi:hypothetical protein
VKQQKNQNFVANHCGTNSKKKFRSNKTKNRPNSVSNQFARQKRIGNMFQIIAKQKGNRRALL